MSNKEIDKRKCVLAMDRIMRCLNDEELFYDWLALGVADGDINDDTTYEDEVLDWYVEDNNFHELMHTFVSIMREAIKDGVEGALYCEGIIS